MTELEQAMALANRVLDKPCIDPDGDICLLAREFLRAQEQLSTARLAERERCAEIARRFHTEIVARAIEASDE